MLSESSGPSQPTHFPRIAAPGERPLTDILKRLEARGIRRVGLRAEHIDFEYDDRVIRDQDISALFRQLGPAARNASSVDLSHYGERGGWQFLFGFGNVSHGNPDLLAKRIESVLSESKLKDMREKLVRSALPVRIGALVFDSTTNSGWSTSHMDGSTVPTIPICLPAELTHALIIGVNGFALLYSEQKGWSNHRLTVCW